MDPGSLRLTSEALWRDALIVGLIDVGLLLLLVGRINRARFERLKWPLLAAAVAFWSGLGVALYMEQPRRRGGDEDGVRNSAKGFGTILMLSDDLKKPK